MITSRKAKTVAELARDLKRYGIRHLAFCDRAGITPSTWVRWREGKSNPTARKLNAARDALDALIKDVRQGRLA